MEEIVFQGEEIPDGLKEIFTEATGVPMVGLIHGTDPDVLFTFHQVTGTRDELIEMRWVVESKRLVARTLEKVPGSRPE